MLEALRAAAGRWGLDVEVTVLTRDPAAFARRAPHLTGHPGFRFVAGDVLRLVPDGERYTHVLHAGTDASADLNLDNPLKMFDTVLTSTRRALDVAVASGAGRFLFFSSGAVYGAQAWEMTHIGEDSLQGPDSRLPANTNAEAKRAAELLCAIHARQHGLGLSPRASSRCSGHCCRSTSTLRRATSSGTRWRGGRCGSRTRARARRCSRTSTSPT